MTLTSTLRRRHGWFLATVFIMVSCFGLGLIDILPTPSVEIHWPESAAANADRYIPSYTLQQGQEIMLVYIGSSSCGVGVSVDWDTDP